MSDNPYTSPVELGVPVTPKKPPMFSCLGCGLMAVIAGVLIVFLLPAATRRGIGMREPVRRSQCLNHLKQIAQALHNYESAHKTLPPAFTVDADGKPLHSWRTLILPYLDQQALFNSIDLTKPWDDPANAKAFETQVPAFLCPSNDPESPNHTAYMAIVTPNSCFRPGDPVRFSEITDGPSNTLLVIEMARGQSVPWMAPQDANEEMVKALFSAGTRLIHSGFMTNALNADGSIHTLGQESASPEKILAMISIAGDDKVTND